MPCLNLAGTCPVRKLWLNRRKMHALFRCPAKLLQLLAVHLIVARHRAGGQLTQCNAKLCLGDVSECSVPGARYLDFWCMWCLRWPGHVHVAQCLRLLALGQRMAIHHQHRRRQRSWRVYRLHQIPARRIRGRQFRHILPPPPKRRVGKHPLPPVNRRIPLPFVLALLNHPVQLRQLRRPKERRHALALGNCPLCGHPDAPRHRLVQRIHALD
ncbi:hypothetical protein TRVL_08708 [Trypanosoma vivax]|nr:hypothetical protein TRVL_08708 [Trypanosoma vivax]